TYTDNLLIFMLLQLSPKNTTFFLLRTVPSLSARNIKAKKQEDLVRWDAFLFIRAKTWVPTVKAGALLPIMKRITSTYKACAVMVLPKDIIMMNWAIICV